MRNSDNKTRRTRESDKAPAPEVPSSRSAGRWLSELFVDSLLSSHEPNSTLSQAQQEQLESARLVQQSYRLIPRYRRLRYPIHDQTRLADIPASEFIVDGESLETRSLCFGVYEAEPIDDSPNFKRIEQPFTLAGEPLQEWLRANKSVVSFSRMKKEELAEKKADRKERRKIQGKPKTVKAAAPKVSDAILAAHYADWLAAPTPENQSQLFATLSLFVSKKVRTIAPSDTVRQRGLDEDFGQDFVISVMQKLIAKRDAEKVIDKIAHYVTRAFTLSTWRQNTKIGNADQRTLQADIATDEGEDGDTFSLFDVAALDAWQRPQAEESPEAYKARCEAKLASLPTDLQDVVGMWIAQQSQTQIAQKLGISQPAVHKRLKKAVAAMA